MLNAYFGPMPEAIYNTAVYFKNTYRDSWITDPMSVEMIKDVDKSDVVSASLIESPVLGSISPLMLSGGVKTLMLVKFDRTHIFNASTCDDNCAKWLLRIAQTGRSSSTFIMSWTLGTSSRFVSPTVAPSFGT